MKRYLCWLAVLGVAAVPDWASAFHRCGWPPPPCGYPVGPVYSPPPVVFVPRYVPVYEVPPLPPPKVHLVPAANPPARSITAPNPAAAPNPAPAELPEPEFRPAGGRPKSDEPPRPASGTEPAPPLAVPEPAPKPAESDGKIPPLKLPGTADAKPPTPAVPSTAPSPAPPPDPKPGPGSPLPPVPPLTPAGPDAKPPAKPIELPPLTLPPEGPPTTSRASPLAEARRSGPTVEVFPAAGAVAAAGTRKVGFFNHTDADLELVIEGKAVKLPRKTYLHAEVPPTFTWKHGSNPAESATVPAGAAGIDVVFRE